MKRIVEIVPASPGWYARWRFTPERTLSYPVTVWALVEDAGPSTRQVVGVDAGGQWPGGADNIAAPTSCATSLPAKAVASVLDEIAELIVGAVSSTPPTHPMRTAK